MSDDKTARLQKVIDKLNFCVDKIEEILRELPEPEPRCRYCGLTEFYHKFGTNHDFLPP